MEEEPVYGTPNSTLILEASDTDIEDLNSNESTLIPSPSQTPAESSTQLWSPQREVGAGDGLPATVTCLEGAQGAKVYLVGTAHFSSESQEDVAITIRNVQPDVVVLELCQGRVSVLELHEETVVQEAKSINFNKLRTILNNGLVQGILHLLLLSMSTQMTNELGLAPGGEFRRALAEARRVDGGCLVHLGDRPYQVTLQRALAALSLWQKFRLAWHFLSSRESVSKEDVERGKQRDILEETLAEMTGEFPVVSRVFVHERDVYLVHSLEVAASVSVEMAIQKNSERKGGVVVGVVGIGHVPGIVSMWGQVQDSDIPPLMEVPPPSMVRRLLGLSVRGAIFGLVLWGTVKVVRKTIPHVQGLLHR